MEPANRLGGPVTVEVRERVPVTTEPDVRIEERAGWRAPEEGAGPEHHAPGTRIWRVDLPAGATTALDGGYEIRIPAGKRGRRAPRPPGSEASHRVRAAAGACGFAAPLHA
ncbi:Conserved hypothetical protein CHP02231 [Actinobacteria bacterium OV450]|nr:Conserved hypothetical protein CHP02231 [Actinobacteria bacterium OV450]